MRQITWGYEMKIKKKGGLDSSPRTGESYWL